MGSGVQTFLDFGLKTSGLKVRRLLGFRVWGLEFRVEVFAPRVQRTQQLRTRVSDSIYVGYFFAEYMIIRYLDP